MLTSLAYLVSVHLWGGVFVRVGACIYEAGGQPQELTTFFLDRVSGTLGLIMRLGWWTIKPRISAFVHPTPPTLGLQVCIVTLFTWGARESNSGPYFCVTDKLSYLPNLF